MQASSVKLSLKELKEKYRLPRDRDARINRWAKNVYSQAAVPVAALVLRTPLTANQVTVIWIILGVVGSVFLAVPFRWSAWAGALCVFLHTVLDFSDGVVARARHNVSSTGIFLDRIGHDLIYPFLMFALALRGTKDWPPTFILTVGFVASLAFFLYNNNRRSKVLSYLFWQKQLKYQRLRTLIENMEQQRESPNLYEGTQEKIGVGQALFRKFQGIWGPEKFLVIVYIGVFLDVLQWIPIFYAVTTVPLFVISVYHQVRCNDRWVELYLAELQTATDWQH